MAERTEAEPQTRDGLRCPDCGCRTWQVDRTVPHRGAIRRQRRCKGCGRSLITYERAAGE